MKSINSPAIKYTPVTDLPVYTINGNPLLVIKQEKQNSAVVLFNSFLFPVRNEDKSYTNVNTDVYYTML